MSYLLQFQRGATRRSRVALLFLFAAAAMPSPAQAGMPSLQLTDLASLRLETMSFFLVGFLVSAWCIQRLWNGLSKDFARLPQLSYGRASALTGLWGLLFLLVLTMISGARELMTPGAWEKQGLTYKLAEEPPRGAAATSTAIDPKRIDALARLREALSTYAQDHDGALPSPSASDVIPEARWRSPDSSGMKYVYLGGRMDEQSRELIALEPDVFPTRRLGLRANGDIDAVDEKTVRSAYAHREAP